MNHLDLFSGIGGFALAARWAGFETKLFCEKDKFCQKVLEKNFPNIPIFDDIKNFDATNLKYDIDLLTGGFPCQPFSVAGKKKGFNDDRYLWPEMYRVIRECKPNWIIAENVPGIISHIDTILEDLENENYKWKSYVVPASATGAPHKRERLWIVANRNSKRCNIGGNNRKERYLQSDFDRNIEALQQEWAQFIPESWKNFNAQNWFESSDTNSITGKQTYSSPKPNEIGGETWVGYTGSARTDSTSFNWEENQPPIPGVDDGLSKRLHGVARNKALGNAIVPQVVFPIMKMIYLIENSGQLK